MGVAIKKIGAVVSTARWFGRNFPETLVRFRYFLRFKKFLDLKNPKDLNEKILYLSLRTDTAEWTRLSDKNAVRDFVKERGLEDTLIKQYGDYKNADEIDFKQLPDEFVLKTTHGSGDVLVVKDKSSVDEEKIKRYFAEFLHHRYGELEGGKHYMRIVPGIVAEELLENDEESKKHSTSMIDYKFWCFNGEPRYCLTCYNRDQHSTNLMTFDMEWNAHPEWARYSSHYREGKPIPRPKNFEKMLDVSRKLSKGFPCVRVDLYNLDGKIYFGEMTFTSLGGMMDYYTPEFLLMAGSEIELPKK